MRFLVTTYFTFMAIIKVYACLGWRPPHKPPPYLFFSIPYITTVKHAMQWGKGQQST